MDVTTMCKEEEETEEDNNMSPSKTSQRTTTMTTINMTGYVIGEKEGAFVKTTTTYANLSKSILPSHHCRRTTSSSPFSSPFCRSSSILHLLLFLLTSLLAADLSCAGFSCLTHCNCFYKSNKLLADCGAQGLQFLPQETMEERSKAIRGDIQILNLTRNTFSELKGNIFFSGKLVNLQRIYMSRVGLERVDKLAFHPLANLVELDLSCNGLKSVPTESFYSTPKLRELDLSANQIREIPPHSFRSLINLKMLNLEKNVIRSLDLLSFEGLSSLETLKLSDNQLTLMDSQVLKPLFRVHSITLSGNPWRCDCRLRQLRQYLLMIRRVNVYDEPKCYPSEVIWTQMDLDSFICPPKLVPGFSRRGLIHVRQGSSLTLECAFYVSESSELLNLPVKWLWQDRPIGNNSKGILSNQIFSIEEFEAPLPSASSSSLQGSNSTSLGRKMKVSRLEVTLMLELNQGIYSCICENKAGSASHNFSVLVSNNLQHQHHLQQEHEYISSSSVSPEENNSTFNPSLHKKTFHLNPTSQSDSTRLFDEDGVLHGKEDQDLEDGEEGSEDSEDKKRNPEEMVDSNGNNHFLSSFFPNNGNNQSLSLLLLGALAGAGIVITFFIMAVIFFARKHRRIIGMSRHRQLRSHHHHSHRKASSILCHSSSCTRRRCRNWPHSPINEDDCDDCCCDCEDSPRNGREELEKLQPFTLFPPQTEEDSESKLYDDLVYSTLTSQRRKNKEGKTDTVNPVVKPPRLAFTEDSTNSSSIESSSLGQQQHTETSITMTSSSSTTNTMGRMSTSTTSTRDGEAMVAVARRKEDETPQVWLINSPHPHRSSSPTPSSPTRSSIRSSPPVLPPLPSCHSHHHHQQGGLGTAASPSSSSSFSILSTLRERTRETSTSSQTSTPLPLMDIPPPLPPPPPSLLSLSTSFVFVEEGVRKITSPSSTIDDTAIHCESSDRMTRGGMNIVVPTVEPDLICTPSFLSSQHHQHQLEQNQLPSPNRNHSRQGREGEERHHSSLTSFKMIPFEEVKVRSDDTSRV